MNPPAVHNAVRTSGTPEAPDAMAVLRRYRGLVIGGAVLGAAISGGLYAYMRVYYPKYTASVVFQVLPPPAGLGDKTQTTPQNVESQDEILQFMQRQVIYIKSDDVLNKALQQDAFHHDPSTNQPTQWILSHSDRKKQALNKDLTVDPIAKAGVFKMSMTAATPTEAANLVNTIASVYIDALRNDNKLNQNERLKQMTDIVGNQEKAVQARQEDLSRFREANHISAIINIHSLELGLLQNMDADLLKAQASAAAAKSSLDVLTEQAQKGILPLSADMQQWVEMQQQLMILVQNKLQLEQDRQVSLKLDGSGSRTVQAIEQRIQTITSQIAETREKLENDGRQHMLERAKLEFDNYRAQAEFLSKARDEKMTYVKDLDHWLVQDRQKEDDLKNQQSILDDLKQKYTLAQLQQSSDDLRIRKFGGDAIPPEPFEVSSPIWYKYLGVGVLGGLALSFGLAYLFELTNTRIRTPQDIIRNVQVPLLGFVPDEDDDTAQKGELATSIRTAPNSMIAESFRQIRSRMIAQANGTRLSTLLVASIAPGGGATTVASNLANGMALNKMRVLLVDANFYRPGLANSYRNIPAIGLSDVINDPSRFDSAIAFNPDLPNLHLLGAGTRPTVAAGEILETQAFQELIDTLKSRYDVVIFDGAPLNLVSDSICLGARVDGVIAVVRAGEVCRGTVVRVREQLRHVRANLLGVVLNAAKTHNSGYFKENYRTFYKYANGNARTPVAAEN